MKTRIERHGDADRTGLSRGDGNRRRAQKLRLTTGGTRFTNTVVEADPPPAAVAVMVTCSGPVDESVDVIVNAAAPFDPGEATVAVTPATFGVAM